MNLDTIAYTNMARVIADNNALTLSISSDNETPCTGGTMIYMPPIPDGDEAVVHWFYAFIHECLHQTGINKADLTYIVDNKINMNSVYGYILNIVADHNIELSGYGKLVGTDRYLLEGRRIHLLKQKITDEEVEGTEAKTQALWVFDTEMRNKWIRHGITYKVCPKVRRLVDALTPLENEYRTLRDGGKPNADLATKIKDILDKLEPDTEDDKERESQLQEAASRLFHDHGDAVDGDSKESGYGKPPPSESGDYTPSPDVEEVCTGVPRPVPASTLSKQVAALLRVASVTRYTGGHKRGKINKKTLARIPSGYITPFRNKHIADLADSAVCLLCDASGSMMGDPWEHASAAAAQMADCLTNINVPYSVYGFNTGYNKAKLHIFKDFHDTHSPDKTYGNMTERVGGCNADGQALIVAYNKLMAQKQKRKVLIVLSDGAPANGEGSAEHLKSVTKEIERRGKVHLISVGILTDEPKKYYSNYKLLNKASDIEATVLYLIKQALGV